MSEPWTTITVMEMSAAAPLTRAFVVLAVTAAAGCSSPVPRTADGVATMPGLPSAGSRVVVTRVVDGDTLHVRLADGSTRTVRLIGIDAPETVRPRTPVQCYGPQASAALTELLPPGTTLVTAFEGSHRLDRYGRDLRDLWLPDGRFVNGLLVAAGDAVARAYPPTTAYAEVLEAAMVAARRDGRGLWGACPPGQRPRTE